MGPSDRSSRPGSPGKLRAPSSSEGERAPAPADTCPVLIGRSSAIRALEEELALTARSDAKILITGETGVGKELVARLVHQRSRRVQRPFVTFNCAGVPDSLLESELFGHMRGSFTDAYRDKRGWFELAHGGTMFMDEVGEMSLRMQALLLRFLETGEIQRVGMDRQPHSVDVRIVAATNRKLSERIATREFREDLYYRLNVIHLTVPPLRDRREDIEPLLAHFLQLCCDVHRTDPIELSPELIAQLVDHDWPGNVRELRNVVERLVVRARRGIVTAADLPAEISRRIRSDKLKPSPQAAPPTLARSIFDRIVHGGETFWSAVYEPFMLRDLTREDVRLIVRQGLEQTQGSYRALVRLFNMEERDYKRFLNFLRKYGCHMPFQQFRMLSGRLTPSRTIAS